MLEKSVFAVRYNPLVGSGRTDNEAYSNAPIIEAVLDVRIEPLDAAVLSGLAGIQNAEAEGYPQKRKIETFKTTFHANVEPNAKAALSTASSTDRDHLGFLSLAKDDQQAFQVRLDGFNFSRRRPYERWSSFRDEARRLWANYRAQAPQLRVTRMAIRTINRLDVPLPVLDIHTFLRTVPMASPELRYPITGFFLQLQQLHEDLKSNCVINETITAPAKPDHMSVILDIDLFREADLPQTDEQIWELFEQFRNRKDEVFEASITDQTRKLFV